MPLASSLTAPTSWRSSSVRRPGTYSGPPTGRGYGSRSRTQDLDPPSPGGRRDKANRRAAGSRPSPSRLNGILPSLRALIGSRPRRSSAPPTANTRRPTPPGRTGTRPRGTNPRAGRPRRGCTPHARRPSHLPTMGEPARYVAPSPPSAGTRGKARPGALTPGQFGTRSRRTRSGGQS